jgi:uncharacterized protein YjdB
LTAGINSSYEQALIGMYGDDGNYIKVTRSMENNGQIQVAVENGGTGSSVGTTPCQANDLYLRLIKIGNVYRAYLSLDGESFTQVGAAVTKVFSTPRFMLGTYNDASGTPDSVATFVSLDVAEAPSDKVTSIGFANQRVDLSAAMAGVDLIATVEATPVGVNPTVSYSLIPMAINTADATVTPAGKLTATQTGKVRVRATATAGLDTMSKTALVEVIADGSGELTSTAPPELVLDTVYAHVGAPVSVQPGAWSVIPDSVSYQWTLGGTAISGATGETYTPLAGDVGGQLAIVATAVHGELGSLDAASAPVAVHAATAPTAALEATIAEIEAVVASTDPNAYTADSWNALTGALADAAAVAGDEDATTGQVSAAAGALTTARAGLTPRGNTTQIAAAIAALDRLVGTDYTVTTWTTLSGAIATARVLVDAPQNVTVPQVTAALAAVNQAVAGLIPAVVTSALVSVADGVAAQIASGQLTQGDYTPATWTELTAALAAANALIATPGEVQATVDTAIDRVLAAVAGLVALPPAIDAGELSHLVDVAVELGLVASDYTSASWAAFQIALGAARALVAAPSSQPAVDQAREALAGALAGLVADPNLGAQDRLATLVASIEGLGLDRNAYTTASWAALQAALDQVDGVSTSAGATAVIAAIQAAVDGLATRVDLAGLGLAIQAASRIDTAGYTAASAASLAGALAAARAVLGGNADQISQADVDAVLAGVTSAVGALVLATPQQPAESAASLQAILATLVRDVAGLKADAYTQASWATVSAAVTAANAAIAAPNATRASVEAAIATLSAAVIGLQAVQPTVTDLTQPTPVVRVQAAQKRVALAVGKSITVPVKGWTAQGTASKLTWKSSKPSIASVSASGKITAKKRGKATISATADGKSVKITVTVRAKSSAKVTKVTATGVPKTMKVGQVAWVTASYTPATATGVKATFASSSAARAAIDTSGRLTAKAPGKATITVKAGTKTKKYTVTVTAG